MSGGDVKFSFCFTHDVTIHTSGLLKGSEIYEKQAGNLLRPTYNSKPETIEFKAHDFVIKLKDWEMINEEIAIAGLGWIGVSGWTNATFRIHLPEYISFYIWDALMKYEI